MKSVRSEFGVRSSEWNAVTSGRRGVPPHVTLRTLHANGFTLLEVMVAVAIMSMVLVTLLGLKNRTIQDVMLAEHITTATMLAKRMMVDTIVLRKLQAVEEEGDFSGEDNFRDYAWKRTISQIPLFNNVFITEIRVAVLWQEGARRETVELVDYE